MRKIRTSIGSVPTCGRIISISHFTKYDTNWPLIVWEMLTNVQKTIPQKWRKNRKKWSGIPYADPDHHQKLISFKGSTLAHVCQVWSTSVSAFVIYPVYRMTESQNDHITSALAEVTVDGPDRISVPRSTLRLVVTLGEWVYMFIELWRERPCLYDLNTSSYSKAIR